MQVETLALPDIKVLVPRSFRDDRGSFMETFSARTFNEAIGASPGRFDFVQDNQSTSLHAGTVRGLHFQAPPYAQGKLVRVVSGRIFDVAVDIRKGSPAYGAWVGRELSAEAGDQLWVPPGFLHGFMTLEDDVTVVYKVTAYYNQASDGAVLWSDPDLAIAWPAVSRPVGLSAKDAVAQGFASFESPFTYGAC